MKFTEKHQGVMNAFKGVLVVVVVVGILAALGLSRSNNLKVKVEDDLFTLSYGEDTVVQFYKDEILSAEVVTSFTMGEAVETISEDRYIAGTWENEEWGTYVLCIKENLDSYLVVTTEETVFVFNYESEKTTESLCSALLEW
ncbi:MAG: hypothetical protein LIP11_11480 [Clostridiales bacterium]|nr:hypothetical protein [Clostridiales bacterium]